MDLGLHGRACVVTGASGGVGGATARLLAAEGASLLLVGRRLEQLGLLAQDVEAAGSPQVQTVAIDVTAPDAPVAIVDACLDIFGRIDVLVNGAGATVARDWDELTDAEWQGQWELNVMAPMRLMRASGPEMARRGWGRIVNISSSAGKRPSGLNIAYGVTKSAMLSLSRACAEVFAGQGVLVNAVTPGPLAGDAWLAPGGLAGQQAERSGRSVEQVLAGVAERLPRGQLGSDEEVAAVVAFLCSEQAANVVGAAWSVDGGSVQTIL
jgi:3-oxoacyl-[acyl-carrier protein] reductase